MTKDERKEVLQGVAKLITLVNCIEKDHQSHDDLMSHCRAMLVILNGK